MKAAGATDTVTKDADDADVLRALLSDYLDGAPDDVAKAAQAVIDFVASAEEEDSTAKARVKQEAPKVKSKTSMLDALKSIFTGAEPDVQTRFNKAKDEFLASLKPDQSREERLAAVTKFRHAVLGGS